MFKPANIWRNHAPSRLFRLRPNPQWRLGIRRDTNETLDHDGPSGHDSMRRAGACHGSDEQHGNSHGHPENGHDVPYGSAQDVHDAYDNDQADGSGSAHAASPPSSCSTPYGSPYDRKGDVDFDRGKISMRRACEGCCMLGRTSSAKQRRWNRRHIRSFAGWLALPGVQRRYRTAPINKQQVLLGVPYS